ncbi:hypothetical protein L6452_17734 [Arctium lappa]|uniref:Uncharacterized protein n=1 Tax=Arctium lappa TaxID=4217 RepID=A0ACB9C4A4_ARCLA|nr:hypothetical protein L6452_17734 [Arctium lappa]
MLKTDSFPGFSLIPDLLVLNLEMKETGRDRRLSCLYPLIDMPEVPKLSPLGLSFRKLVRSEGSTETEPSSLADLSAILGSRKEWLVDPPSSLHYNPSRKLWQLVLIALALIPIYTVNDSAPREQRTITAKARTNIAAYEIHPGESYTTRREPLSL